MRKVVVKINGIIKEFNIETTNIRFIKSLQEAYGDFEIVEYKAVK